MTLYALLGSLLIGLAVIVFLTFIAFLVMSDIKDQRKSDEAMTRLVDSMRAMRAANTRR